jgi:glycosyltransferase involved in cell wall biosynthesis
MHVVQVLAALNVGGSELVATELSEFLTSQGHKVTVIAADGPIGDRLRSCGAEHLDWKIGKKRLATLGLIRQLADWLKAEKPDLVHVHSRFPAWVCWLAIRKLDPADRPRFVTTMHGHYSVSRYSSVMARGNRTIAVSEHIRKYTLSNYPYMGSSGIVTIHGGASREDFPYDHRPPAGWRDSVEKEFPELKDRRWILFPGRVTRWKGHADFIQLMARLADIKDLHGVIVGGCRAGSRYLAELESLVGRYGLDDRITFTGDRLDIRDWMASSVLALNLSDDPPEAFGRTVLETLCLGRPIVAWNHGGAAEIMAQMFPRGAVEPRDHRELESRVRAILVSPPRVPPSDAFSLERSMHRHLEVYEELLKEPVS